MSKYSKRFFGKAASKYINQVTDMIKLAESSINEGVEFQNNMDEESKVSRHKTKYLDKVTSSTDNLISTLDKKGYTIIVDDSKYEYISNKVKSTDEDIAKKISYVVEKLETLCKEKYIIPKTTPKVEKAIENVKNILPEFESISTETNIIINKFIDNINEIDNK